MTERKPLAAAEYAEEEGTLLFMARPLCNTTQGDLDVDVYMAGFSIEAEVRRNHETGPSTLVLSERITITPTIQSWLKDLLDRAQKEDS